jgi:hypothetical protein
VKTDAESAEVRGGRGEKTESGFYFEVGVVGW